MHPEPETWAAEPARLRARARSRARGCSAPDEVREREPELTGALHGASLFPDDLQCDPRAIARALAREAAPGRSGASARGARSRRWRRPAARRRAWPGCARRAAVVAAGAVVVAAGPWSAPLAASAGAAAAARAAQGPARPARRAGARPDPAQGRRRLLPALGRERGRRASRSRPSWRRRGTATCSSARRASGAASTRASTPAVSAAMVERAARLFPRLPQLPGRRRVGRAAPVAARPPAGDRAVARRAGPLARDRPRGRRRRARPGHRPPDRPALRGRAAGRRPGPFDPDRFVTRAAARSARRARPRRRRRRSDVALDLDRLGQRRLVAPRRVGDRRPPTSSSPRPCTGTPCASPTGRARSRPRRPAARRRAAPGPVSNSSLGRSVRATTVPPAVTVTGRELSCDVDAVERVAQVAEDGLLLDEPGVGPLPVQRGVPAQPARLRQRVLVGPDRVLEHAVADAHGPVGRVALERAVGRVVAALEQRVRRSRRAARTGTGRIPVSYSSFAPRRVEHDAVADQRAQPPPVVGEEDAVRGRLGEIEVEGAAGLPGERAGAEGEAHASDGGKSRSRATKASIPSSSRARPNSKSSRAGSNPPLSHTRRQRREALDARRSPPRTSSARPTTPRRSRPGAPAAPRSRSAPPRAGRTRRRWSPAIISGPVRPIPVTACSIASQLPIVFGPSGGRSTRDAEHPRVAQVQLHPLAREVLELRAPGRRRGRPRGSSPSAASSIRSSSSDLPGT